MAQFLHLPALETQELFTLNYDPLGVVAILPPAPGVVNPLLDVVCFDSRSHSYPLFTGVTLNRIALLPNIRTPWLGLILHGSMGSFAGYDIELVYLSQPHG
jgi:hypothetical protein